ncbi:MAG TPA: DUF262 domain-containing protein [Rhodanobacteraceae bacterium]
MFDTTKEDLKDILRKVDEGKLQLPDFQRDYVWNDEDVRSLIASIAKGFPVGALLTLEAGGEVNFKPRLLEGVPAKDVQPAELLLDGQQRMTSLFQVMYSNSAVQTKTPQNKHIERYYFIDIKQAVMAGADFFDAIVGVPADRIMRSDFGRNIDLDLSSDEKQFERDMFPLNRVFNDRDWMYAWRDYHRARNRDVSDLERDFYRLVVDVIARYKMPIIRLDKTNKREAICLVFEKVNVGGQKLDAFELVTAIYAAQSFDLREDWNGSKKPATSGRKRRMLGTPPRDVLKELASTDFLQACTLLHTRQRRLDAQVDGKTGKELPQVTCKRDALLALPLTAYRDYADTVEQGFVETARFLNAHKIIWVKDIPYPPLLVALASVFAIMGKDAKNARAEGQLAQWFWSVTLGELYGSTTESRLARDVPELVRWIGDPAQPPRSLDEAVFQGLRLKSLRSRLSAAYKAIHALLMQQGCRDFITGKSTDLMTFFDDDIDIHHIFPKAWCKKQGIEPKVYDAIINKTPLSKLSNIAVGGDAPSVYLKRIEDKQGISAADLDAILRTHLIEPALLRNDDFTAFCTARQAALEELIAGAMQKPVVLEIAIDEADDDSTDDTEEEVAA